jgi:hypothetical protein
MQLSYIQEHLTCFNYDNFEKSQIEIISSTQGENIELTARYNEIVFLMEGDIKYVFDTCPEQKMKGGNIFFLPMGYRFICNPLTETRIVIFRLYDPIRLCERYSLENLFKPEADGINDYAVVLKTLEINPRMRYFIIGLTDCIEDGVKCRHYFEMKIKEFFLILRMYYSKNELRDFLGMILSNDVAFSEYVRNNRNKYSNVTAFAESLHLTKRQFTKRFHTVFGRAPYGWMKEGKVLSVQKEITSTKKPFKQIAFENGFKSLEELTRFCKKELGNIPTMVREEKWHSE